MTTLPYRTVCTGSAGTVFDLDCPVVEDSEEEEAFGEYLDCGHLRDPNQSSNLDVTVLRLLDDFLAEPINVCQERIYSMRRTGNMIISCPGLGCECSEN